MRFYIVDVFAETKYSGNQLAVFRDSARLQKDEMQMIAKEMNYAETTFITSEKPYRGGYNVRISTPTQELPFAGHPTLGTAYVIQSQIARKPVDTVRLNLKVGQIPVTLSYRKGKPDLLWMRQRQPEFGRDFPMASVLQAIGLKPSDRETRFPVQWVSTGLPFIILPLKGLEGVRRARPDAAALRKFLKSTKAAGVLVFSTETYDKKNDLNVRVLFATEVIPEDPATGSANGCLAAYLLKHQYFKKRELDLRVEQGYEIDRKSLLLLKASENKGRMEVDVGGRVQFIARGEFTQLG